MYVATEWVSSLYCPFHSQYILTQMIRHGYEVSRAKDHAACSLWCYFLLNQPEQVLTISRGGDGCTLRLDDVFGMCSLYVNSRKKRFYNSGIYIFRIGVPMGCCFWHDWVIDVSFRSWVWSNITTTTNNNKYFIFWR